jgi:phospholipid/cholesterol/gamma-HCH transport system substrate-binding protein
MFPQFKNYVTLELKPRLDQYYILELVSDPFGKYSRVETTTTPPGSTIVTETYEDKLKFSVEFAKRYGDFAFRMGLIESTGGVGGDYYAFDDRFKFSVDAWNFNSNEPHNERANLKATADLHVSKVLFLSAGYDNILNVDRRAPFIGAGLRFTDDDIKYLMGSMPIPKERNWHRAAQRTGCSALPYTLCALRCFIGQALRLFPSFLDICRIVT